MGRSYTVLEWLVGMLAWAILLGLVGLGGLMLVQPRLVFGWLGLFYF